MQRQHDTYRGERRRLECNWQQGSMMCVGQRPDMHVAVDNCVHNTTRSKMEREFLVSECKTVHQAPSLLWLVPLSKASRAYRSVFGTSWYSSADTPCPCWARAPPPSPLTAPSASLLALRRRMCTPREPLFVLDRRSCTREFSASIKERVPLPVSPVGVSGGA